MRELSQTRRNPLTKPLTNQEVKEMHIRTYFESLDDRLNYEAEGIYTRALEHEPPRALNWHDPETRAFFVDAIKAFLNNHFSDDELPTQASFYRYMLNGPHFKELYHVTYVLPPEIGTVLRETLTWAVSDFCALLTDEYGLFVTLEEVNRSLP